MKKFFKVIDGLVIVAILWVLLAIGVFTFIHHLGGMGSL